MRIALSLNHPFQRHAGIEAIEVRGSALLKQPQLIEQLLTDPNFIHSTLKGIDDLASGRIVPLENLFKSLGWIPGVPRASNTNSHQFRKRKERLKKFSGLESSIILVLINSKTSLSSREIADRVLPRYKWEGVRTCVANLYRADFLEMLGPNKYKPPPTYRISPDLQRSWIQI